MFTHMEQVRKETYRARDTDYELMVFRVQETGEYRIYIAKGGLRIGDIFTANQEVVGDAKLQDGTDVVEQLIGIAKDDINRNEFDLY
ncbi:hypothetical protein [Halorhodospira sp. 9622]|uniref:hypothetical protein n=1 Tax=Halorhodospira sp. 9622 TaxID=2899136 RepID=UPI001EE7FF7B|nr:hypothetical protein [Halorhodospira sp. 9622]MCG5537374.1 hypothetical protein [Halorhodospira sp. 9622]